MMKKQLIMEKALELFAKQGFEATSVQQITEHSDISKGAFYLSFKSKDELINALIDHFMTQFISDIDYEVNETKNNEELLYNFYYTTFKSFQKRSDFAKVFLKEPSQSFNEELILKVRYYDTLMGNTILSIVERVYNWQEVSYLKYDLAYCIKGFLKNYTEIFIFYNLPFDVDLLAKSLVEKTDILAGHITVPFMSEELVQIFRQPTEKDKSKEDMLEITQRKIDEMEESIEKESLILLKQQILDETYSQAIVKGLLENIRKNPHCKWVSFLLSNYFQL